MRLSKAEMLKAIAERKPPLTTADFPPGCPGRNTVSALLWEGAVELVGPDDQLSLRPRGHYVLREAMAKPE